MMAATRGPASLLIPYECLGLLKWNMLWKALRLIGCGERICSDFESQSVVAFEVENSGDR
jgi:hypothetical protein